MTTSEIVARLDGSKRSGAGYLAKCPAHQDDRASLSVSQGESGGTVIFDHGGCTTDAVLGALGLTMKDLAPNGQKPKSERARPLHRTAYEIKNAAGEVVAVHVRTDLSDGGKTFSWQRDGKPGLGGFPVVDLPLYGSEALGANLESPVFLCEGEKARDALTKAGLVAVATVTGAAATPSEKTLSVLAGRDVLLWPDHDNPGRAHMARLEERLEEIARGVLWVNLGTQKGDDAADFFAGGKTREDLLAAIPETKADDWSGLPRIVDVLLSMPPTAERLPTGIPALDKCSRGGFARGRIYTIVGPPGRGKTALAKQFALRFAKLGAVVIGFFVDEGVWPAAVMLAEGMGFNRSDLEDRVHEIKEQVRESTEGLDVLLPNPDDSETVVDAAERWLQGIDAAVPVVLVVDSIQRVRCTKGAEAQTAKERAEAMMTTLRRIARRLNALIIATSKANRASFARKNPSENISAIASGLDSSAIEYDSDAFLFLEGDPDKGVTLTVAKNRPGDGSLPRIRLHFDRSRAEFTEVDAVIAEKEARDDETRFYQTKLSNLKEQIRREVLRQPYQSGRSIHARLKASEFKFSNEDFWSALSLMAADKEIEQAPPLGGGRPGYRVPLEEAS